MRKSAYRTMAKETSTTGKILLLLRRIGIRPIFIMVPLALSLLSAVFEGVGMGLLIPIINGFLTKSFAFVKDMPVLGDLFEYLPQSVLGNDRLLFAVLLGGFTVLFVLRNVMKSISTLSVAFFASRTLHHLRKSLFRRYLGFGKLFFDVTNIGHHSTLLLEFSRQALMPLQGVDRFITASFSLTAYLVLMLVISWKLTLIALPLFFLLHLVIRAMIMRIRALSHALAAQASTLGKKSVEILSTIPLVKSHRMESQELKQFTEFSDQKAKLDYRILAINNLVLPIQEIVTVIVAIGIFMGALAIIGRENLASASAMIVFFYAIMSGAQKLGAISGFRSVLATASGPLDEVLAMFDENGKFAVKGGSVVFPGLKDSLQIKNLSFSYGKDRDVLKNVSFPVEKGKMTAIVGPTGAGKSTIISLLLRYYDCPPGTMLFDGTDVREFTLDSYIRRIGYVSQETLLLHDSLRSNILYGLENVPEKDLQTALKRARLDEFIAKLPQGLDTLIGDRGVKLSGGEKQRVSIARALLKGADILILDEATSSLDSRTEKLIQEAIDEAVAGRTSIVIAHRLSTIRNADRIVVLDQGKVAEQGTVDELLEKRGLFFTLWEEQKF